MTDDMIAAAREWLSDCMWEDEDADTIADMPDDMIERAVAKHYDGGIAAFIACN